ncbi:CocE/NonD family hydrolase [Streptomyces sp. 3214.6]|uniref:CocE/NonD family hydrolase n=1 Tax=Streptomyces sp. 3214.6 TaxID=1882757 RepID=UPI001E543D48|nr:CocE/NonD family hydrolase [Streptomyces sp. 3214.6]
MGIDQWREETEWPLSRAVDTDFHLRAAGRLTQERPSTAEQPEAFRYDPMDPAPIAGGALCMSDDFRPGPLDQSGVEAREDVLVFTTEPLTEDVEVTGRVRAVLFAATDGPSTDWVARLCDVDENGVSHNVVGGSCGSGRHRARWPSTSWTCGRPASSPGGAPDPGPGHLQQLPALGPQPQHG